MHYNLSIFPSPTSFRPERWIENPRLDKYLIAFARGSRQCIGINLAYAELYLALSTIFRRYGSKDVRGDGDLGAFELFDTTDKDWVIVGDGITPLTVPESKGIRIRVVK